MPLCHGTSLLLWQANDMSLAIDGWIYASYEEQVLTGHRVMLFNFQRIMAGEQAGPGY